MLIKDMTDQELLATLKMYVANVKKATLTHHHFKMCIALMEGTDSKVPDFRDEGFKKYLDVEKPFEGVLYRELEKRLGVKSEI